MLEPIHFLCSMNDDTHIDKRYHQTYIPLVEESLSLPRRVCVCSHSEGTQTIVVLLGFRCELHHIGLDPRTTPWESHTTHVAAVIAE